MPLVNWPGDRWMIGLGLAVLILEVLVVVRRGDLPTLLVFLILDSSGALVAALVQLGTRRTGQLQACLQTLRDDSSAMRAVDNRSKSLFAQWKREGEVTHYGSEKASSRGQASSGTGPGH